MGQRIDYYKNKTGLGLEDLLLEQYAAFAAAYVHRNEASIEEFGELYGQEIVLHFMEQHPTLEGGLASLDKFLLDEMTAELVTECTTFSPPLEHFGSFMYTRSYRASTPLVVNTQNKEFLQLWYYLLQGRSLRNEEPFESYSKQYSIGFLSAQESLLLKEYILHYFGSLPSIQEKYWNSSEKLAFKKAKEQAETMPFSVDIHPVSRGIEGVLQMLKELGQEGYGLISGIE